MPAPPWSPSQLLSVPSWGHSHLGAEISHFCSYLFEFMIDLTNRCLSFRCEISLDLSRVSWLPFCTNTQLPVPPFCHPLQALVSSSHFSLPVQALASSRAGSLGQLAAPGRCSLNECLLTEWTAAFPLALAIAASLSDSVFKWPIGEKGTNDESVDGKRGGGILRKWTTFSNSKFTAFFRSLWKSGRQRRVLWVGVKWWV